MSQEYSIAQPFVGILHLSIAFCPLKKAHVYFCFHGLSLAEGGAEGISFLPLPLSIRLCTESSLLQTPAMLCQWNFYNLTLSVIDPRVLKF